MRHFVLILAFLGFCFSPFMATGQDTATAVDVPQSLAVFLEDGSLDYDTWDRLADRIEIALAGGRASDSMFSRLREQLVDWRTEFSIVRDANNIAINTLKTQISTLGPPPAEGGSEPAILTQRRDELALLLSQAQRPVQVADEAFSRADVLIGEVDALARTRQGDALISLGPSPLTPINWVETGQEVFKTMGQSWRSMTVTWGTETQQAELRRGLPLTLVLTIIGLILLLRGRAWVIGFRVGIYQRTMGPGRRVIGFLISLGQVAAPLLGIISLLEALNRVGVLDLHAQIIADSLPLLGTAFFAALWLGSRVFGSPTITHIVIDTLSISQARQGRIAMAVLGLAYGLHQTLNTIAAYEGFRAETLVVLGFPVIILTGFALFRLGGILKQASQQRQLEGEAKGLHSRLLPVLGQLLMALGIAGPLVAAIGFTQLAVLLVYPTILTLGVLAILMILHLFITDMYGFLSKREAKEANEALLPVLVSFILALMALPVLALIWGARITDLTEVWTTLGQGFVLGGARVTPKTFLTLAVVFSIGYALTRIIQGTLKNTILPKTTLDKGGQNAITSGLGYVGIFMASLVAITSAGVDLSSLAIVAGALSVGIGFGLQNVVSNFVSGIILLIERPISEGDWIEVGGQSGYVRDISVRSTRIETFDRTDVILPNSDLISGVVTNYTRGNTVGRVIVPVGVAYGTDTRRVEAILLELVEAHPMVRKCPGTKVVFQGFGADALDFEMRGILFDVNNVLSVKSDLNHDIAQRFQEEGIEIPFAQRDVWLRNPEALTGINSAPDPRKAKSGLKAALQADSDMDGDGEGDE